MPRLEHLHTDIHSVHQGLPSSDVQLIIFNHVNCRIKFDLPCPIIHPESYSASFIFPKLSPREAIRVSIFPGRREQGVSTIYSSGAYRHLAHAVDSCESTALEVNVTLKFVSHYNV